MAKQITSVEFYMHRSSNRTGWNLQVDIHDVSAYTSDPTVGDLLGSKTVSVDTVPLSASKDWVVFTFDTPITISNTGFYAVHLWCDAPSNFQASGVYTYETDDWSDATGGAPLAGDERKWDKPYLGSWTAGGSIAYRINCTEVDDNESESPTATSDNFAAAGVSYGFGVRSYLDAATAVPSKATTPSPADTATSVDFSALGLSWVDGGGADTFDVYMGPVGALVLVSSAQVGTTLTVDTADVPWGQTIYWRIDSTNAGGTTTGDTWSFDVVIIRSVKLGANGAFIVVTAENGVYLSTDSGANWSKKTPDGVGATDWAKGICSSDGTYIIVVSDADAIYRSANSGTSWAAITPAGGDTFSVNKMATSDDGQYMVIVGTNTTDATESCYISTDYGATWTAKKPVTDSVAWTECDISNDGTIIAVSLSSYFYISFDSGTTWTEQGMASTAEVWEGLSISGDGDVGLITNTNDNDEFFIGANTVLYSQATWAESVLTSAGRAILDDATAADQATTLGLGTGDSPTFTGLTLSSIAAEATDVDKFLVDSTGVIKFRTGAEVLSDIGASASGHLHDTQTLQHDGVNSDGGAFSFTTTGLVTFNQSIAAANYAASNLLTACATNAGEIDFTAGSKKLDIEDNAVVSQDYSSDGTPQFTGLEIGHATDTTLTRVSSGDLNVEGNIVYRAGGTDVPVTDGGTGVSSLTDHGILLGSGSSAVTPLGVAGNGQIPIGSAGVDPVLAAISGTTDHISITNGAGSITVNLDTNTQTLLGSFNGIFLEKLDFTISEAGGVVTGSLEKDSSGDLTQRFSDGYSTLDCTPAKTVTLTPYVGTNAVPKVVFVYILQSAKTTIAASNSDWPATEHCKIARLVLKSAATTGTDGGALGNQNVNDFASAANGEGHITHVEQRIRQEPAQYDSGIALTLKNSAGAALTTGNSSTAVEIVTAEGKIYQLHRHTFPAFDMYTTATDDAHITNQVVDEGGAYETTAALVTDITHYVDGTDAGVAIGTNKYFNLVIWGVQNRSGEASHIMINLPTGQYTTSANAVSDIDGTSVFSIPAAFKGTGFLIARLTFRLIAGPQWTYIAQEDLRGQSPGLSAGVGVTTTDHALLANLDFASAGHTGFQAQGDVLDDLNTLGVAASDGQFIVATGSGAFAYESTTTARTSLGVGTGDSPQFTGIELGHASDTTLTRVSAGVVAIEGTSIAMVGGAHHDGFSDFVSDEHVAHSGVTLTAGSGIAGGGDISAGRTFDLDINSLSVATLAAGDFVPFWDITATATNKKITFANFEGTLNHDSLSGFVGNEHIDHTGVTLTAGTGLTGGGDISANRSFAVDGVLEDLDTLGAAGSDGQFIVATGAGAFAYEATTTVRTSLGLGTGDSPQFTGIELGHASDTTLTRVSAGIVAIEGTNIMLVGDAPTAHAHEGTAILSTGEGGGTKFLREDGDGTCSWQAAAGGGDVTKVGTPVDNQVGVWTGDGTIEGDTDLTWDGTILTTLTVNLTTNIDLLQVDGTRYLANDGTGNLFFGDDVFNGDPGSIGRANNIGSSNIGIGYQAGYNNYIGADGATGEEGEKNVYIGYQSGYGSGGAAEGYHNACIGWRTLYDITTGYRNMAFGASALENVTSGHSNSAIGFNALKFCTTGNTNMAVGRSALNDLTTGVRNIGIGGYAGQNLLTGSNNTLIGHRAGFAPDTASHSNNVCLGAYSGQALSSGTDNVFVGYYSGSYQTTATDLLIIDNRDQGSAGAEVTDALIYGSFNATPASQTLSLNARVLARYGIETIVANDDVADPPTDAELDTAFGDPTALNAGFIGILDDAGAGTDVYICWTTGNAGEWYYTKGTKAV